MLRLLPVLASLLFVLPSVHAAREGEHAVTRQQPRVRRDATKLLGRAAGEVVRLRALNQTLGRARDGAAAGGGGGALAIDVHNPQLVLDESDGLADELDEVRPTCADCTVRASMRATAAQLRTVRGQVAGKMTQLGALAPPSAEEIGTLSRGLSGLLGRTDWVVSRAYGTDPETPADLVQHVLAGGKFTLKRFRTDTTFYSGGYSVEDDGYGGVYGMWNQPSTRSHQVEVASKRIGSVSELRDFLGDR